MNFVTFPINSTNLFPAANATSGAQLLTEFNLRSREGVGVGPYQSDLAVDILNGPMIGPSFVHSETDFDFRIQEDGSGTQISSSTIEIMPGTAVLNGHFVQSLVPVTIDLLEGNRLARERGEAPLKGQLVIGLRAMYSTEQTMTGALMVSSATNENFIGDGTRTVFTLTNTVLPQGIQEITINDIKVNRNTYSYDSVSGEVTFISAPNVNTKIKISYFTAGSNYQGIQVVILPPSEFILPTDTVTEGSGSSAYTHVVPYDRVTAHLKLGTFNFINGAISNVVNDHNSKVKSVDASRIENIEALLSDTYVTKSGLDPNKLYIFAGKGTNPQTGYDTWCDATESLIVWDKNPKKSTVRPSTREAKFIASLDGQTKLLMPHKQVDGAGYNLRNTAGQDVYYQDKEIALPLADFDAGTAGTVDRNYTNKVKSVISKIDELKSFTSGKQRSYINILNSREFISGSETCLPKILTSWNTGDYIIVQEDETLYAGSEGNFPSTMYIILKKIVSQLAEPVETAPQDGKLIQHIKSNEEPPEDFSELFTPYSYYLYNADGSTITTNKSYFRYTYTDAQGTSTNYYYVVSATKDIYADPILLTGNIIMAQEDMIGGFLNVRPDYLDQGYVYRDDEGHLKLLDYSLLRSGTLAYQLGEDIEIEAGLTTEEIQNYLDEYINERVAFPNYKQKSEKENPEIINVTITLAKEENAATLTIGNIDSRFGGIVYLHINGEADQNTVIKIVNCEKIRIDSNIGGSPLINLSNCNLYYDSSVLDQLFEINDLKLWYQRFNENDPNLIVDNMTVLEVDAPVIPEDVDYWTPAAPNDNHYMYALRSITFASDGTIIGCSLYVKNSTTENVTTGKSVYFDPFILPQGYGLTYPITCLTKPLKVTGSFVNAYATTSPAGFMVMDTNFTALTQCYDPYAQTQAIAGTISFYVDANIVENYYTSTGSTDIDGWESGSFHIFNGGVIG